MERCGIYMKFMSKRFFLGDVNKVIFQINEEKECRYIIGGIRLQYNGNI